MRNLWSMVTLAIVSVTGLNACSETEPATNQPLSDPYRLTSEECHELFPSTELFLIGQRDGNPDAIRCYMTWSGYREAYDPLQDLYLLYRIEAIEPEGLDERIRALDRREIATKIRNWHSLNDYLEPVEDRNWRGCAIYDPIARELITRGRDPDVPHESDHCLPK